MSDSNSTLYIIGNGFDLHHKFKTSFIDFAHYLRGYDMKSWAFLSSFYSGLSNIELWNNFEEQLGEYDWEALYDEHNEVNIQDESFKPSDFYGVEDAIAEEVDNRLYEIKSSFHSWLHQVMRKIYKSKQNKYKIILDNSALFLSFNYTLTLEKVYSIPRDNIIYIHGEVRYRTEDLIFGHSKEELEEFLPELDENGDSNRTFFSDAQDAAKYPFYAFKKPTEEVLNRYEPFFKNLSHVRKIIVLGHSVSKVDLPYFRKIAENSPNAFWEVSYFSDNEISVISQNLDSIGIPNSKLSFFKIIELIP